MLHHVPQEQLEPVPGLGVWPGSRDGPDNPEGPTDQERQHGTPERHRRGDQVAGQAQEQNEHTPGEAPSTHTVSGLLPGDGPPQEIVGTVSIVTTE